MRPSDRTRDSGTVMTRRMQRHDSMNTETSGMTHSMDLGDLRRNKNITLEERLQLRRDQNITLEERLQLRRDQNITLEDRINLRRD